MVAVTLVLTTNWYYQSYTKKTCLAQIRQLVYQPKYCMYKMSSCSSWLLHAVLDKRYTLISLNLLFFMARHMSCYGKMCKGFSSPSVAIN